MAAAARTPWYAAAVLGTVLSVLVTIGLRYADRAAASSERLAAVEAVSPATQAATLARHGERLSVLEATTQSLQREVLGRLDRVEKKLDALGDRP